MTDRTTRQVSNVMPVRVVPVAADGGDANSENAIPVEDAAVETQAVDIGQTLSLILDELRTITTILFDAYQLRGSVEEYREIGRDRAA